MTDRIQALIVALDADIRDDDIQPLITAIQQMRGVLSVTTDTVLPGDYVARERARANIFEAVIKAIKS